jgi:hypothetical protein
MFSASAGRSNQPGVLVFGRKPRSHLPNSVIPTAADHRNAVVCEVEEPAVTALRRFSCENVTTQDRIGAS